MIYQQLHLTLPAWIHEEVDAQRAYPSAQDKVALAIQLSRRNVDHRSGGPFGAAVFSGDRLVGVGVNRVVPHNCSAAHAEVMALATSQQRMQSFRLNQAGGRITLATSAQPCSMCYGALIWAGIDELLIAARADGFDGDRVLHLADGEEGIAVADGRKVQGGRPHRTAQQQGGAIRRGKVG